jgi:hypothetical protein
MRLMPVLALAATLLLTSGCRSRYIEATVTNHTAAPIQLLEVDYPSASFGTQNLAPGDTFHYRFKVLGSGPTKLLYTDATHQDHTSAGPDLKEGDEGRLTIDLAPTAPTWQLDIALNPKH